jgi:hypothetical protein
MSRIWISCKKFTCKVVVDRDGKIVDAAPIVAKFRGQSIVALRCWIHNKGWGPIKSYGLKPNRGDLT